MAEKLKVAAKAGNGTLCVVAAVGEGVTRLKAGDRVAAAGAGYARHATKAVVPLPENVSVEQGAYMMLAATSLYAIRRAQPVFGEYMAVVGLGIVGQIAAQLLRLHGNYVIGWDMIEKRTAIAREWGIDETVLVCNEDAIEKIRGFTRGIGIDGAIMAIPGNGTPAFKDL